jgi:hypothetical protein
MRLQFAVSRCTGRLRANNASTSRQHRLVMLLGQTSAAEASSAVTAAGSPDVNMVAVWEHLCGGVLGILLVILVVLVRLVLLLAVLRLPAADDAARQSITPRHQGTVAQSCQSAALVHCRRSKDSVVGHRRKCPPLAAFVLLLLPLAAAVTVLRLLVPLVLLLTAIARSQ